MCCGSAARRRFGAADHALAQVRPRQFIFLLGGGVVRLTAKPRYLLLLHRGNEKSNTVTALVVTIFFKSTIYFFEKNNWVLFFRCAFGHVSWTKHKNLSVHSAAIVETLSVWLTAPIQSKPSYTSSSPFLLSFPLYFQESRNIKQRENKRDFKPKGQISFLSSKMCLFI